MIGGIWLFSGSRIELSAYHVAHPLRRRPDPGEVPLGSVAHRSGLAELLGRARGYRAAGTASFLWVDLVYPTQYEMTMMADVFDLPNLQVDDSLTPRQRPKLDRDGTRVFLVMKALTYLEATSDIETHQVSAFAGAGYLLTIAHGRYDVADSILARFAREPGLAGFGTSAGLYALLDSVVDQYLSVAAEISNDIEEVEESVFSPERTDDAGSIYGLKRENLELRRAVSPLASAAAQTVRILPDLVEEGIAPYFQDVADHLIRVNEYAESNDQLLMTMLMASTARMDLQQNSDMRRISAWVAMAAVPTLIAGIYGMNFEYMPELDEYWGYPFALGLMGTICLLLYRAFKRSGWL